MKLFSPIPGRPALGLLFTNIRKKEKKPSLLAICSIGMNPCWSRPSLNHTFRIHKNVTTDICLLPCWPWSIALGEIKADDRNPIEGSLPCCWVLRRIFYRFFTCNSYHLKQVFISFCGCRELSCTITSHGPRKRNRYFNSTRLFDRQ